MDGEKSKLLWRCRRGIREMDIVLQDFIHQQFDGLSEQDQASFRKLLDEADLDILNWLMQRDTPEDDELKHIVSIIRESRKPV